MSKNPNVIDAIVMYNESVELQTLRDAFDSFTNRDLVKLVEAIFTLPYKGSIVEKKLQSIIDLSERVDKLGYQDGDLDAIEEVYDKLLIMGNHGQGLDMHDMARIEMLEVLIDDILCDFTFGHLRDVTRKWLNVVREENKERTKK